ncbi:MAG TPA: hypothetical protein P5136_00020 [Methanofastidiosum sp.]|nr:hypothetical protein [Methanofastidiosum sp.]
MIRNASILDYQRKILDPTVWENFKIKPEVKRYIYKSFNAFFISQNLKGHKEFVSHMYVGSSLATYFYKEDSDLDVKVVIDPKIFREYNPQYEDSTDDDLCDELIESARGSHFLTSFLPGTFHPLDAYFFTEEEADETKLIKYDSLYNLITDTWVKPPKKLEGELSTSYVLNYAKDIAQRYIDKITSDIELTKRDSIDFLVLRDFMKTLDKDDIRTISVDFETALEKINKDLEMLVKDREIVKQLRKQEFSKKVLRDDLEKLMGSINYSDGNLIYKILQRYGYLRILFELASLYRGIRVTSDDVINVYRILEGQI